MLCWLSMLCCVYVTCIQGWLWDFQYEGGGGGKGPYRCFLYWPVLNNVDPTMEVVVHHGRTI